MNNQMPSSLRHAAEEILGPARGRWWIRDLSQSYSWLKGRELYWLIDGETDSSAILLRVGSDRWRCLNRPTGLSVISETIRESIGDVPSDQLPILRLCELLMEWYDDPRGYVCSPAFLQEESEVLSTFEGRESVDSLRSVCTEPQFVAHDDRTWRLSFNALNKQGGVDRWSIRGRHGDFDIEKIRIHPISRPFILCYE